MDKLVFESYFKTLTELEDYLENPNLVTVDIRKDMDMFVLTYYELGE